MSYVKLHRTGKSRGQFLKHSRHDYDVDAALYAWNNPYVLKEPRRELLGAVKDLTNPKDIANIEKKKERGVVAYIEYEFDYNGRTFLVKLEETKNHKEQFYSIHEK